MIPLIILSSSILPLIVPESVGSASRRRRRRTTKKKPKTLKTNRQAEIEFLLKDDTLDENLRADLMRELKEEMFKKAKRKGHVPEDAKMKNNNPKYNSIVKAKNIGTQNYSCALEPWALEDNATYYLALLNSPNPMVWVWQAENMIFLILPGTIIGKPVMIGTSTSINKLFESLHVADYPSKTIPKSYQVASSLMISTLSDEEFNFILNNQKEGAAGIQKIMASLINHPGRRR
jgi:hypothetical protein